MERGRLLSARASPATLAKCHKVPLLVNGICRVQPPLRAELERVGVYVGVEEEVAVVD